MPKKAVQKGVPKPAGDKVTLGKVDAARFETHDGNDDVVAAEELEIALYARHRAFVSYGYYIARRTDDTL